MNEKRSYTEYLVVGSPQTQFAIGFEDYQAEKDMLKVTVDNKDITEVGYTVTRNVGNVLEFNPAVPVASVVRIQRVTDIDAPFYIFTAGNSFVPSNVDQNFKQLLHSQQEVKDRQDHLEERVIPLVDGLEEALEVADAAAKAAQEAKEAAEEAAQTSRSTDNVQYVIGFNQTAVNDGIASVLNFPTANLRTGMRIYVKSYYHNLNKGGGWFIYDASKALINNEVTIINGWVRVDKGYLTMSDGGARTDINIDNTDSINNVIKVASDSGIRTVYNDGMYMIGKLEKGITTTPFGDENAWWLIKARSNVTIVGSRKDGWFIKAGLASANVGEPNTKGYMVVGDYNQPNVENFAIKGFTIDNNGQNNLAPPAVGFSQPLCPNVWFQRGTNISVVGVHFLENSGHQTIVLDQGVKGGLVTRNLFTDNGKGLKNNVECVDHSSIYIRGSHIDVHKNVLEFTTERPDVSTALEIHGVNCNVYDNFAIGYPYALIRAAFFGQDSKNVKVHDNTFIDCTYGVNLDGANGTKLTTDVYDNTFIFRTSKPFATRPNVAVGHVSGGGFTAVTPSSNNTMDIVVRDNLFVQPTPIGWSKGDEQDNLIFEGGKCTSVRLLNNTVKGFKGGYRINFANNKATYLFKDILINCGSANVDYKTLVLTQTVDSAWQTPVKELVVESTLTDCYYDTLTYFADNIPPKVGKFTLYSTNWITPYQGSNPDSASYFKYDYSVDSVNTGNIMYSSGINVFGTIKLPTHQNFYKVFGISGRWNMDRMLVGVPTESRFFGDVNGDRVRVISPASNQAGDYVCVASSSLPHIVGTWKALTVVSV